MWVGNGRENAKCKRNYFSKQFRAVGAPAALIALCKKKTLQECSPIAVDGKDSGPTQSAIHIFSEATGASIDSLELQNSSRPLPMSRREQFRITYGIKPAALDLPPCPTALPILVTSTASRS
jgi:hypothetical protein